MKRYLALITLIMTLGLFGAQEEIAAIFTPKGHGPTALDNKRVVREFFQAFHMNNATKLNSLLAPDYDVIVIDESIPEYKRGNYPEMSRDLVKRMQSMHEFMPEFKLTINYLIAEDNQVVAIYAVKGSHEGKLLGISPTGKDIELKGISIFTLNNGKIIEVIDIMNWQGVAKQLGYTIH